MDAAGSNTIKTVSGTGNTRFLIEGNRLTIISDKLDIGETANFISTASRKLNSIDYRDLVINLDSIDDIDSAGVMAIFYLVKKISSRGTDVKLEGGSPAIRQKLELFSPERTVRGNKPEKPGFAELTGKIVYDFFTSYVYGFIELAANVFYWAVHDLFKSKTTRKGEFVHQSVLIGANAALIIIVMSFAIGLVLAMQSAGQLKLFGADIYIVDLVVIAMMSQMGPLITAIMIAGRSGSAIAAEIASMKVSSELDALNTMGLNPIRFVIVPKLYAALFTMPFLIVFASVAGIAGGATAAYYSLDISPEIFFNRMESVMHNKDLLTAFVKSQAYASIIVLTGSFYGLRVERGAEGVGKVTTVAVVVSLSLVILADSVLGLLFY
jgi:phospholipid/cholesterol/gamma-HCH transport system permease protein